MCSIREKDEVEGDENVEEETGKSTQGRTIKKPKKYTA
jgi:hypothetical protein